MKIFGSTDYVNEQERGNGWYQLQVINMWDWSSKPICYDYAGATLISYRLNEFIKIDETSYKARVIENLTSEMQRELIKMGYMLE